MSKPASEEQPLGNSSFSFRQKEQSDTSINNSVGAANQKTVGVSGQQILPDGINDDDDLFERKPDGDPLAREPNFQRQLLQVEIQDGPNFLKRGSLGDSHESSKIQTKLDSYGAQLRQSLDRSLRVEKHPLIDRRSEHTPPLPGSSAHKAPNTSVYVLNSSGYTSGHVLTTSVHASNHVLNTSGHASSHALNTSGNALNTSGHASSHALNTSSYTSSHALNTSGNASEHALNTIGQPSTGQQRHENKLQLERNIKELKSYLSNINRSSPKVGLNSATHLQSAGSLRGSDAPDLGRARNLAAGEQHRT